MPTNEKTKESCLPIIIASEIKIVLREEFTKINEGMGGSPTYICLSGNSEQSVKGHFLTMSDIDICPLSTTV